MATLTSRLKAFIDRIFPEEESKSAEYSQGYQAPMDSENPHRDGTYDHKQWQNGHDQAERDRRAW